MNIAELSNEVYEDLNGMIVSVAEQDTAVTVVYECDHCIGGRIFTVDMMEKCC
jgi:hypothetical protein